MRLAYRGYQRHRKRFIDDAPWGLETSFYPGEFADRGADKLRRARDIDEGTVTYLRNAIGVRQVGYRDWVTVRAPNATEADFFKLPPDGRVAVYEMFRTAFDGNEQPMRLTVTVVRADRNQFIVDVGTVPELKPDDGNERSLTITRGKRPPGPKGIGNPGAGIRIPDYRQCKPGPIASSVTPGQPATTRSNGNQWFS